MICIKEEIMGDFNKITHEKIRQATKNNKEIIKNIDNRLPPGQSLTKKFPILDLEITPDVDLHNWRLEIFGLVKNPLLTSSEFLYSLTPIIAMSISE